MSSHRPHPSTRRQGAARIRGFTLALAAMLGLGWIPSALALSLGRVEVKSALGEPLLAEIDFLDISPDEEKSLTAAVASADAFRSAGLTYSSLTPAVRAWLLRRPDGRLYISLSSSVPIGEPVLDLLLEANWSSGRLLRDYTLLFNPPRSAPEGKAGPAPAGKTSARSDETSSGKATGKAQEGRKPLVESGRITVQPGDTASEIALAIKPSNVSLDQMLVALLRANPGVFQDDNVNRIRAGAVLNMPGTPLALETARPQATRIIAAQNQEFNDFRRKVAGAVPPARAEEASRRASGKVQTLVAEGKETPADRLTLSKPTVDEVSAEERLARERSLRESAARADEIARNIYELGRLGASAQAAAASAPASSASEAGATALVNPLPASPASAASAPVSAASSPPPSRSLIDELVAHPWVPAFAGALLAVLGGFAFFRARRRKSEGEAPASLLQVPTEPAMGSEPSAFAEILAEASAPQAPAAPSPPPPAPPAAPPEPEPGPESEITPGPRPGELDIDFNLDAQPDQRPASGLDLEFDIPETVEPLPLPESLPPEPDEPEPEPGPQTQAQPDLDLGSLSLDLGSNPGNEPIELTEISNDPLETKLVLAEEFRAIGDEDGARALIEEVLEVATGTMKDKAEKALGKLR